MTISEDPRKLFVKTFNELCYGQSRWSVFQDFCEMAAISLRQPFYRDVKMEERYMEIVSHYERDKVKLFSHMLTYVIEALNHNPSDFMGTVFHELEMHNENMGQFFTPYPMSQMMAQMLYRKDELEAVIKRNGYVDLNEPTCGAGGMVIAFAQAFKEAGFNPHTQLFVVAQDLDFNAANMTFIQLSLLGIPALVERRNTLTLEFFFGHYTPMYFIENWPDRIKTARMLKAFKDVMQKIDSPVKKETAPVIQEPAKKPEVVIESNGQLCFNF